MQRIADTCRRHGVLLIADEVMSGVGRTGRFLAMEHYGIEPTSPCSRRAQRWLFPTGRGGRLGPSVPMHQRWGAESPRSWIHVHLGNPLSAAVGLEVLNIIDEEQLVSRAATMGALLMARLTALDSFPMVGEIRGKGLLIGVEFVADREQGARSPRKRALPIWFRRRARRRTLGLWRSRVTHRIARATTFLWRLPTRSLRPKSDRAHHETIGRLSLRFSRSSNPMAALQFTVTCEPGADEKA